MKFLIPLILAVALPCGLTAQEGVNVTVTVSNIPGAKGTLLIGLFDSAGSFTKRPMKSSPKVQVTSTAPVTVTIPNVPPGTYAISVVQDLNGNGRLDKTIVGMPKEPLAFSQISKIPKGKPSFSACSFDVGDSDVSMSIRLVTE
ncbi:MAG: DUF2141 domain-containing protein [Verrucomicrobiota bacterium]